MVWKMIKSEGITRTPRTVPKSIPPTAENPIDLFPLAPAPVENISGIIPIMKARDVISIGRRRTFDPSVAESTIDMPFSRPCSCKFNYQNCIFGKKPDQHYH